MFYVKQLIARYQQPIYLEVTGNTIPFFTLIHKVTTDSRFRGKSKIRRSQWQLNHPNYGFKPRPQRKKNWDQNQCLVRRGSSEVATRRSPRRTWHWWRSKFKPKAVFFFAALTFWFFCVDTKEHKQKPEVWWLRVIHTHNLNVNKPLPSGKDKV